MVKGKKKIATFKKNLSPKTFIKYFKKWDKNKVRANNGELLQLFRTDYSVSCRATLQEAERLKREALYNHIKTIVQTCIFNTNLIEIQKTNWNIYMRGIYSICKSRKDKKLTFLYNPDYYLKIVTVRIANPLDLLGFDENRIFEEYQIITELKIILKDEPISTSEKTQEVSGASITS